jgi:ABC-type Fe3+-hydroxamate transport system substrate-binding protein
MSMHIEGPWLSTTGKRKGKKKFASAEAKRKAEQLDASWEELKKKHSSSNLAKKVTLSSTYGNLPSLAIPEGRNTTAHIKSRVTAGGSATLAEQKVYTGTKVKGIATMHKSNAVPVFSDEEAIDISKMRR